MYWGEVLHFYMYDAKAMLSFVYGHHKELVFYVYVSSVLHVCELLCNCIMPCALVLKSDWFCTGSWCTCMAIPY